MDSEPGSRSMNVSLWGYRNDFTKWVVFTVDFRRLFTKACVYLGAPRRRLMAVIGDNECACVYVQAVKPTTHSGWLIPQNPLDPVTGACWATKRPFCA